jgi:murein L,D-transpeptidase YafK
MALLARFVFPIALTIAAAPALAEESAAVSNGDIGKVDRVFVDKSERRLDLLRDGAVIASFPVMLGFNPDGHKTQQGDGRTPEGDYVLDWRNPKSRFHLSLHVSYPSAADREQAAARGVSPGGDIFIHGTPGWYAAIGGDWTLGCIAVSNAEIEVIWKAVPDGTPITIQP